MEFDKNLIPLLPISGVLFLFFLGPGITFMAALTGRLNRTNSYHFSNIQQIVGILLSSTLIFTFSVVFFEIILDINLMIREVVYLLGREEIINNDLYSTTLEKVGIFYSKIYLSINLFALILGFLISLLIAPSFRNKLYKYFRGSYINKENRHLRKKDIDHTRVNILSRIGDNQIIQYSGILKNYEFDRNGKLQRIYLSNAIEIESKENTLIKRNFGDSQEEKSNKIKGLLVIPYHTVQNMNLIYFIKNKKKE